MTRASGGVGRPLRDRSAWLWVPPSRASSMASSRVGRESRSARLALAARAAEPNLGQLSQAAPAWTMLRPPPRLVVLTWVGMRSTNAATCVRHHTVLATKALERPRRPGGHIEAVRVKRAELLVDEEDVA